MAFRGLLFKASPRTWLLALVATLALLALACQAAPAPTAAPEQAAPAPEQAAPVPEPVAAPKFGEVPTAGQFVERAGLRVFVPEGYLFGGPIIPSDPRTPRYGGAATYAWAGDPPVLTTTTRPAT